MGWDISALENTKILLIITTMHPPYQHILYTIIFYLGPHHFKGVNIIPEYYIIPLFPYPVKDMGKRKLPYISYGEVIGRVFLASKTILNLL